MNVTRRFSCWLLFAIVGSPMALGAEPIRRVLPPEGIEIAAEQKSAIEKTLKLLKASMPDRRDAALAPDVDVFTKAVDYALLHGEFYQPQDVKRVSEVLQAGVERSGQLSGGKSPWTRQHGRVVRGYRSRIDGSVQPYGLVIPDDVDFEKPVPLYVWLHGRGDKQTDVHFIHERLTRDGQIKPPGAIVLHPFGRHCLGFKSAGEIDVLEAIEHVQQQYRIDPDRIVLMGFSMGGAGAWHLGAHYTDRFVAISPGAGFVETAQYTNLKRENYPPIYEQRLWGAYDVPDYARNMFNRPVIAYSGELDKQMQAARMMEEAFKQHGRTLTHIIGPGMGHKYHPDSLQQILDQIAAAVVKGRPRIPNTVSLQTRTLRYNKMDWVAALRLDEHWQDTRIDAVIVGPQKLRVTTKNVKALRLSPSQSLAGSEIEIDGQIVSVPVTEKSLQVELVHANSWRLANETDLTAVLAKKPGLQGPIDDVFLEPFLVVTPSGRSKDESIQAWIDSELAHFSDRWRGVFRGELRTKSDAEVTPEDIQKFHLVVWGTPESNKLLQRVCNAKEVVLPVNWRGQQLVSGQQSWPASSHMPAFVYPNPLNPQKYVVVNSGPTFREAHDRTNSLQNPKLPDWAIIDISQSPSASAPGRVAAAGFFDEQWKLKSGE